MRLRWKIAVAVAVTATLLAVLVVWITRRQNTLEETAQALRRHGFKTELTEFDFSTSPEMRARAAVLAQADLITPGIQGTDYSRRSVLWQNGSVMMSLVNTNAAMVVWRHEQLRRFAGVGEDLWPGLREILNENREQLDAACTAALSGPIGFNLVASHGNALVLSHLGTLRSLGGILGLRAVMELHDGNREAAWTNVLADTRLVTAWQPERVEASYLTRYACVALAYSAVWQALQAGGWSDDQLAHLQAEWAAADFFKGLSETAAFTRANMVATCRLERQQPPPPGMPATQMVQSPRAAWYNLTSRVRQARYRETGTYEEEKSLLLYYRDREVQLRRAVQARSWSEMRRLPGVTNSVPFRSRYPSRVQMIMNTRQIASSFQGRGVGLLGQAAQAETRSRLIVTAIALERYLGWHGAYPKRLDELVPGLLARTPTDFMDGQPLRYRCTEDGHFVLYSVGLDCTDDGGQATVESLGREAGGPGDFGIRQGTDLVWPRPASASDVKSQEESEVRRREFKAKAEEERTAALHQAILEQLQVELEAQKAGRQASPAGSREPLLNGQPLSKVLRNPETSGTKGFTLDELLTLRQITSGKEPRVATFELPLSYDVVKRIGSVRLLVDAGQQPTNDVSIASSPEWRAYEGGGEVQTCMRGTNGDCLLVWNTTYDPPGQVL